MIVTNLAQSLKLMLPGADEVWISVALITDEGLHFILREISPAATQYYLVGLDLFPPVTVLKKLQSRHNGRTFNAKIAKPATGIFHPKLYIIRRKGLYTAILGSANLTGAGLNNNTELSYLVSENSQCEELVKWLRDQLAGAYPLTDENILLYERWIPPGMSESMTDNGINIELKQETATLDPLKDINFSDRYFFKEDHLAFRRELWADTSVAANRERKQAEKRFLQLHEDIYPRFRQFGLDGLFPNKANHIVSMYHHSSGTGRDINAMWLSYGKSKEEIKAYRALFPKVRYADEEDDKQSFINHARLQVRIELKEIGIWILFGKNNGGSSFDRGYFRKKMEEYDYRSLFYNCLKALPVQYWIIVNHQVRDVSTFNSPEELHEFCKRDNDQHYFTIGKDYIIEDPEMSASRLSGTVLTEFQRLYPIYMMMRHHFTTRPF